jgi:hypothetical protein
VGGEVGGAVRPDAQRLGVDEAVREVGALDLGVVVLRGEEVPITSYVNDSVVAPITVSGTAVSPTAIGRRRYGEFDLPRAS